MKRTARIFVVALESLTVAQLARAQTVTTPSQCVFRNKPFSKDESILPEIQIDASSDTVETMSGINSPLSRP